MFDKIYSVVDTNLMTTQQQTAALPKHLHAAHEWTAAAGEIAELRNLTGDELAKYCAESAANNASEGDGDVDADDLESLHAWLVKNAQA